MREQSRDEVNADGESCGEEQARQRWSGIGARNVGGYPNPNRLLMPLQRKKAPTAREATIITTRSCFSSQ